jgi:hypothetical protein
MSALSLSIFFLAAMTAIVVIGGIAAMKLSFIRKADDTQFRVYRKDLEEKSWKFVVKS